MIAMLNPAFNFGSAESAYSHSFREVCVCDEQDAVFAECNCADELDERTEAKIAELGLHRGPFTVSLAKYGRRGDPSVTEIQLARIRNQDAAAISRLRAIGIPAAIIALIEAMPVDKLYRAKRAETMRKIRARVKATCCHALNDVIPGQTSNEGSNE